MLTEFSSIVGIYTHILLIVLTVVAQCSSGERLGLNMNNRIRTTSSSGDKIMMPMMVVVVENEQ